MDSGCDLIRTACRLASVAVIGGLIGGCAGSSAPAAGSDASPNRALVARPCAELATPERHAPIVAVFVEVADVTSPVSPSIRQTLSSAVEVNQVAGVLLEGERTSGGPWMTASNERDVLSLRIVKAPADPASPITLDLAVGTAPLRHVAAQAGNQEPTLVAIPGARGSRAVVLTPYYLFEPKRESLRTLVACKTRPSRG